MKKSEFKVFGSLGGQKRWSNYKLYLVEEIQKLTTKHELDFYLSTQPSPSELQRVLMELRKQKNDIRHKRPIRSFRDDR